MATESVATDITPKPSRSFRLEERHIAKLRRHLIDAIQAQTELDRITAAIKGAAEAGWPASHLTSNALAPRSVEMDVYEAADLVHLLDVLEEV